MVVNRVIGEGPTPIAGRQGVSPIGTDSPNTGATAATNSSYQKGAYASGISNQTTETSYTLQDSDYQGIVIFNTSSAVAITLNSALAENFTCFIVNIGSGAITLTPSALPSVYPINGGSSLPLASGVGVSVFFADREWWAFAGATFVSVTSVNGTPVTDPNFNDTTPAAEAGYVLVKWQTATGSVSAEVPIATLSSLGLSQPDGTTITETAGVYSTVGYSGTVDLAPLTTMGTPGSLTVADGLITAYVAPT